MLEKPVALFYPRAAPITAAQPIRIADIVIIHDSRSILRPLILDIVTAASTNSNATGSCCSAASTKVSLKLRTYAAYTIPPLCLWPIAIERSGSIPPATLDFFSHMRLAFDLTNAQAHSLIHALLRGTYSGVAQIYSHVEHRARIHASGAAFPDALLESRVTSSKHADTRAAAKRRLLLHALPRSAAPPAASPEPRDLALFSLLPRPTLRTQCSSFGLSCTGSCADLAARLASHPPAITAFRAAALADPLPPFDLFEPRAPAPRAPPLYSPSPTGSFNSPLRAPPSYPSLSADGAASPAADGLTSSISFPPRLSPTPSLPAASLLPPTHSSAILNPYAAVSRAGFPDVISPPIPPAPASRPGFGGSLLAAWRGLWGGGAVGET